eukprot:1590175-Pyramimonas_sp.AAC.1
MPMSRASLRLLTSVCEPRCIFPGWAMQAAMLCRRCCSRAVPSGMLIRLSSRSRPPRRAAVTATRATAL